CLNAIKAGPPLAPAVEHGIAPIAHQAVGKTAVDAARAGRPLVTGRLMWKRAVHGGPPHAPKSRTATPARGRWFPPLWPGLCPDLWPDLWPGLVMAWSGYGLGRSHTRPARWRPRQPEPGPARARPHPRAELLLKD